NLAAAGGAVGGDQAEGKWVVHNGFNQRNRRWALAWGKTQYKLRPQSNRVEDAADASRIRWTVRSTSRAPGSLIGGFLDKVAP
ncbi:MAG: hypothetical protein WA652_17780, partial [Xanthobacteraceae bacterium]